VSVKVGSKSTTSSLTDQLAATSSPLTCSTSIAVDHLDARLRERVWAHVAADHPPLVILLGTDGTDEVGWPSSDRGRS
jgi:hypothetical protein